MMNEGTMMPDWNMDLEQLCQTFFVDDVTHREKFNYQLEIINAAWSASTILLEDFNLDWARRHDNSYADKN